MLSWSLFLLPENCENTFSSSPPCQVHDNAEKYYQPQYVILLFSFGTVLLQQRAHPGLVCVVCSPAAASLCSSAQHSVSGKPPCGSQWGFSSTAPLKPSPSVASPLRSFKPVRPSVASPGLHPLLYCSFKPVSQCGFIPLLYCSFKPVRPSMQARAWLLPVWPKQSLINWWVELSSSSLSVGVVKHHSPLATVGHRRGHVFVFSEVPSVTLMDTLSKNSLFQAILTFSVVWESAMRGFSPFHD